MFVVNGRTVGVRAASRRIVAAQEAERPSGKRAGGGVDCGAHD